MFQWYVTRGYPLTDLLQLTWAEKYLLHMAYEKYADGLDEVAKELG